jgi:hypothetical protein
VRGGVIGGTRGGADASAPVSRVAHWRPAPAAAAAADAAGSGGGRAAGAAAA